MKRYRCPKCQRVYTPFEALSAQLQCPHCGVALKEDRGIAASQTPRPLRIQTAPVEKPLGGNGKTAPENEKAEGGRQKQRMTQRAAPLSGRPVLGQSSESRVVGQDVSAETPPAAAPSGPDVVLEVRPPTDVEQDVEALTQLLSALALPLVLEFAGAGNRRRIVIRCRRYDVATVKSVLAAVYGSPEVRVMAPTEDPAYALATTAAQQETVLTLDSPEALPLRVWRSMEENDPVLPVLAALGDLREGEAALVQWVIAEAAPRDWNAKYRRELLLQRRKGMGVLPPVVYLLRVLALTMGSLSMLGYLVAGRWLTLLPLLVLGIAGIWWGIKALERSGIDWERVSEDVVEEKLNQVGYKVLIRVLTGARTPRRAKTLAQRIARAFSAFRHEQGNALHVAYQGTLTRPPTDITTALRSHRTRWNLLGDKEIVTMWHLPIKRSPDLFPVAQESHRVPHAELFARQTPQDLRLGTVRREQLPFYVGIDAVARVHGLIVGRTRMGKSGLQARIASHLAEHTRHGLIIIDPHDTLATMALKMLPPERLEQVHWVDFGGRLGWYPGYNPYDVTMFGDPYRTFMAFGEEAREIFSDFWGPRMAMAFSSVSLAMVLANAYRAPDEQFSIPHAFELLLTNQVGGPRDARLEALLQMLPAREDMDSIDRASRDAVLAFFTSMGDLNASLEQQVRMPVVSKFHEFLASKEGRMVFSSPRTTFDIRGVIERGEIMVITTGSRVSKDLSRFVGSLMLSTIAEHIKTLGEDHPPLTVIVDEAHTFSRARLGFYMAELGKWGVNFIIGTQGSKFMGAKTSSALQGERELFEQMITNSDFLAVFRTSGVDAGLFAKQEFGKGEIDEHTLINLRRFSAVVRAPRGLEVIPPTLVDLDPPEVRYPENEAVLQREDVLRRTMRPEKEAATIAEQASAMSRALLDGSGGGLVPHEGVLTAALDEALPPEVKAALEGIGAAEQTQAPQRDLLETLSASLDEIFGAGDEDAL